MLLVALSLACLEISFFVKGVGAVILLFRLEYKMSVICHNVNTQKVKIARRDRLHNLATNQCETFENLHIHSFFVPDQSTAWYSMCSAQEKCVRLTEPYTTHI